MLIKQLTINNFRNLQATTVDASPGFNIFYGSNGAGKTSLLEAIYMLGHGKSFRTSQQQHIIQHNTNELLLFALLGDLNTETPVGLQKTLTGQRSIKIAGEKARSLADLSNLLPLQLISTDSYRVFHEGPSTRRQFIDRGVFHVEPLFMPVWKTLQQSLKQRNAALKNKVGLREVSIWDNEIAEFSHTVDQYRKNYIHQLEPILKDQLALFLQEFALKVGYFRGWDNELSLQEVFQQNSQRDLALGYTYYGPQRADLIITTENTPVHNVLSQGQQKLASYALLLAQGILMKNLTNKQPIYLVDDLPSELDPKKRTLLTNALLELEAQVFISGITIKDLNDSINLEDSKVFHVEHGLITEAITSPEERILT